MKSFQFFVKIVARAMLICVMTLVKADRIRADDFPGEAWIWGGHYQVTVIPQGHGSFPASYSGSNSLVDRTEVDASVTSTLFLGTRLAKNLELYADPEMAGGNGLSDTLGIAGFPNGEIFRVSNPTLSVYLARAYLQWVLPLGSQTEIVASAQNQLAGIRAVSRLTVVAGKFSLTDFFDHNSYSHDPRNQFLNWALMDAGAWDYAADVRGYTQGLYVEFNQAAWSLRFAEVQDTTSANGTVLSNDILHTRSENAELGIHWKQSDQLGAIRILGFWNHADMGNYLQTLDTPTKGMFIADSATQGAEKYGFVVNVEQQMMADTGLFARLSWNNGATESWNFTEIDRSASLGAQIAGALWRRLGDRLGIAVIANGLSPNHEEYLAAGGYGFIIGDGALNYGLEEIGELYYDYGVIDGLSLSPDLQLVKNPAYNRDRGPVEIYGLRVHFEI